MHKRTTAYYRGERISNALLFLIGAGFLLWTLLLFLWRQGHLSTGLFYSGFPLSAFCMITAVYRFVRSLKRYKSLTNDQDKFHFLYEKELPFLEGRLVRFKRKRKVDQIGFILGFASILMAAIFHFNHLFLATAVSITIFSAILLSFDLLGQFRTAEFVRQIKKHRDGVASWDHHS